MAVKWEGVRQSTSIVEVMFIEFCLTPLSCTNPMLLPLFSLGGRHTSTLWTMTNATLALIKDSIHPLCDKEGNYSLLENRKY